MPIGDDESARETINAQRAQILALRQQLRDIDRGASTYAIGETLRRALDRARDLHPWQDRLHSLDALRAEVEELAHEVGRAQTGASAEVAQRIRAEALDCAVVAWRIMEGR